MHIFSNFCVGLPNDFRPLNRIGMLRDSFCIAVMEFVSVVRRYNDRTIDMANVWVSIFQPWTLSVVFYRNANMWGLKMLNEALP